MVGGQISIPRHDVTPSVVPHWADAVEEPLKMLTSAYNIWSLTSTASGSFNCSLNDADLSAGIIGYRLMRGYSRDMLRSEDDCCCRGKKTQVRVAVGFSSSPFACGWATEARSSEECRVQTFGDCIQ